MSRKLGLRRLADARTRRRLLLSAFRVLSGLSVALPAGNQTSPARPLPGQSASQSLGVEALLFASVSPCLSGLRPCAFRAVAARSLCGVLLMLRVTSHNPS